MWDRLSPEDSVPKLSYRLAQETSKLAEHCQTEEDLRIGFEKLLDPILEAIGVSKAPQYERSVLHAGRMDAVHGRVVIEYEAPGAFRSQSRIDHADEQLRNYLLGLAVELKDTLFLFDPKVVGVGFDGEQIFFLQYGGDKNKAKVSLDAADFVRQGPYPFDQASARTLLAWMRALPRQLLTAENLAADFGPAGAVAKKAVSALVDAQANWAASPRVAAFLEEWKRLFGIVYGEHFGARQSEDTRRLAILYEAPPDTGFQVLLFCVHTYFVLLMKLMAAELLTMRERSIKASFCGDMAHADREGLKARLTDVEDGGVYAHEGITNFLEGDFFRWYLDAFSPRLEDAIRDMARSLAQFEPETGAIAPSAQRDLLKKLYQYLVPQEVRHNLGEYYTPDWLAELALDEVGYKGDARKRLLDPACGSGTFLVLAVGRARELARENHERPLETAKRIVANIWGFDLNPLAVLAARMNYLFALGELREQIEQLEIPVYLADSLLWPETTGHLDFDGGKSVPVHTAVRTFHVPSIWIERKQFMMRRAAPVVEETVRGRFTTQEALERFRKEGLVFPPHEPAVAEFYEELAALDKENKNGIWARFLKNAFAPRMAGRFDYVVGNPPWIRWQYLSQAYRDATLGLWQKYGLFSLKGQAARLGGGEKDLSMLFTYAATDFYLSEKGTLGFLITQEVFKSKGAGEGFRRFDLNGNSPFRVLKAHDLVAVQPFEGAANKTAMIVLRKSQRTTYPVPYTVWKRRKGVGRVPGNVPLKVALPMLAKRKMLAEPIDKGVGSWRTFMRGESSVAGIEGMNPYQARRGAATDPYGVFWLELVEVLGRERLVVRSLPERGKRRIAKVPETMIEPDL
ncbi:MAG TPA: N-6 DNA methylase, partial [Candidatus Brocadiia bacterium]|nr:N-6 DNA methylase [Candidatus Brocadiia bacterium]